MYFTAIDEHALNTPHSVEFDIAELSEYLCAPAKNNTEKARAIFRWITKNISYDTYQFFSHNITGNSSTDVLKSKRAVCAGFSSLFQSLADKAGLECATISGHGKGYGYALEPKIFAVGHDWNAVKLDGTWQLIDSTWGAGSINDQKEFIREFDDFYFCTPPRFFIFTHLPEDDKWQLLDEPIKAETYFGLIKPQPDFFRCGIKLESHKHGEIVCEYQTKVVFRAQAHLDFTAHYSPAGQPDIKHNAFVQRAGERVECHMIVEKTGTYILRVFSKEENLEGPYHELFEYTLTATKGTFSRECVPETYGSFHKRHCYLIEPINGRLPRAKEVFFRLLLPGALEAAVIIDKQWTYLSKKNSFMFEGKVFAKFGEAGVYAKYSGNSNFEGLLKYKA